MGMTAMKIQYVAVAPREGRVSRNSYRPLSCSIPTVAPREERVSRNPRTDRGADGFGSTVAPHEGCVSSASPRRRVWMMPQARAALAVYQSKLAVAVLDNSEGLCRVLSCTKVSPRREILKKMG